MPFELIIKKGDEPFKATSVHPKGSFSIKTSKTDFYYRDTLEGAMTFTGDDYQLIMNQDDCVEFGIVYKDGREWRGYFTQSDCIIHRDKRYLEVEPHPDDAFRWFLPYLDLEFNLLDDSLGDRNHQTIRIPRLFPMDTYTIRWNRVPDIDFYRPGDGYITSDIIDPDRYNNLNLPDDYNPNQVYDPYPSDFPEFFTLYRINNIFVDGEWKHTDLIYAREYYKGTVPPSLGNWVRRAQYEDGEFLFIRRPLGHYNFDTPSDYVYREIPTDTSLIKRYELADLLPLSEYIDYENIFFPLKDVFNKLLQFVKLKGGKLFEFTSQMIENEVNPWTLEENHLSTALVAQKSDVKRPTATERATKEVWRCREWIDTMCRMFNCGWTLRDGQFVFEHAAFFDRGLSYLQDGRAINPASIENLALGKGFMELSNQYSFDKGEMKQFEIFKLTEGRDEVSAVTIEYKSNCVNRIEGQNIDEYEASNIMTDIMDVVRDQTKEESEYADAGLVLVTYHETPEGKFLRKRMAFGAPELNGDFFMKHIIRDFHPYRRSFKTGFILGDEYDFTPKPYIIHEFFFPYRRNLNPYMRVLTELGLGVIRDATFNTKTAALDVQVGYFEITQEPEPPRQVDLFIHEQSVESNRWEIHHNMRSDLIMRPVVYVEDEQVEYNRFFLVGNNVAVIEFTKPVKGEAYLVSLRPFARKVFVAEETDVLIAKHDFDSKNIVWSAFLSNGEEIMYDELDLIDDNELHFHFSRPVNGYIIVADTDLYAKGSSVDGDEVTIEHDGMKPLRPFVLSLSREIAYNYSRIEETLLRVGFTKEVVGQIIVKFI